ncbi:hypothetical protein [Hufsiella ginkgonis]|uniref:Uncharacterized protein n=1 Tax=Hufsiella ginkgonis TaxID=2695274 RepID=A0A7K1XWH9_9SPHI|nr:hypothetical protein [Hufsiella ginkgonis]MXV14876.1 hypothetical protein [Hufsiella ginkgonis]
MPYNPFPRLDFNDRTCFLSGDTSDITRLTVFPQWILDAYQLTGKPFKLLDESMVTYDGISVPCSPGTLLSLTALENRIEDAFNGGYGQVKELSQEELFHWIGKMVYGIMYHEIRTGMRQQAMMGERMNFSQSLVHKFSHFLLMLQSVIQPVVFEGVLPWTVLVFPVENEPAAFNYRDEINTLTFSLSMKNFGIIACLQDNGANAAYHEEILQKVAGQTLQPIQFEELCARFFYSSYLFNRLPEYTVLTMPEATYVEAMPLRGISNKPLFDAWQVKVYGQVLENFWKPWGYLLLEIIKDPEHPMSFLLDEYGDFRRSGLPR